MGLRRNRRRSIERLEGRWLCASDWQNSVNRFDVNGSGYVEPLDALIVINDLNQFGVGALAERNAAEITSDCDTSGDGNLSAIDVLLIINSLNSVDSGDRAPEVRLPNQAGEVIDVSSLLGTTAVVLYFYPKDNTPGCTVEALDFSSRKGEIEALGARVFGVSLDPVKSHEQFADQHQLNFDILSDVDSQVTSAFGALTQTASGTPIAKRTTFIIGTDGLVKKVFTDVQVASHGGEVVSALRASK